MHFQRRILFQITLPALGISLVLGIVCFVGVQSLNRLQSDRSRILRRDVRGLEAALDVEVRLRQIRLHSLLYVMNPVPARKALLDEGHAQFEAGIEKARQAADAPQELSLLERVTLGYRKYRAELEDRSRWPGPNASVEELLVWADAHPVRYLLVPCEELLSVNRQSMETTADANEALTGTTRFVMILLGIVGPIAGLMFGIGIAWRWSRSLTRLQLRIRDTYAELDREIGSIHVAAEGDWRQLDQQMGTVLSRVREVVVQLQDQQQELIRTEHLAVVGHLAAGVAHEVRNPLTGIKLLIEAALRPVRPAPLNLQELGMILEEIRRVERTVQMLLDYARPSNPVRTHLELGLLLRQTVDLLGVRFEQRHARPALTIPERPIHVNGDRDQIISLLTNLLINANEASPDGAEIAIDLATPAQGMLQLSILDRGAGISDVIQARLFSPFASDKQNGTGLGLCVAQRIAREHGGEIRAENHPDGGACFTLTLPTLETEHANTAGSG